MKHRKKTLALLICIAILFITSFSALGFFSHRKHGCSGYGCVICIQLAKAKEGLEQMGHQAAAVFIAPAAVADLILTLFFSINLTLRTPVKLKVRLDN